MFPDDGIGHFIFTEDSWNQLIARNKIRYGNIGPKLLRLGGNTSRTLQQTGIQGGLPSAFTAREFNFGKSVLSLAGGPGAVVGYTHNTKGKYGVIAGVSGTFQATLRSGSPLSLSLGFTAMLGCHMSSNPAHGSTLEFHSLGVRYAYIPEITIRYRFL